MARLLLISDIDDTLRNTHVRFPLGWVNRGLRSRSSFTGMADLYLRFVVNPIKDQKERQRALRSRAANNHPDRLIVYVTAALRKVQWFPNLFLVNSKFPVGAFEGREWGTRQGFKLNRIEEQIRLWDDRDVILVGDNGEKDPIVFTKIRDLMSSEFPERKIYTYLHMVYDREVPEGHIKYLTAADLAVHFYANGWVKKKDVDLISKKVLRRLEKRTYKVLPKWVRSPEALEFWPETPEDFSDDLKARLDRIKWLCADRLGLGKKLVEQAQS